uniref:Dynein heavy chain n=1 Tax=Eptatretus burgeri TaxID=7764 RepID=A0A8C4QQU7_EPTBU
MGFGGGVRRLTSEFEHAMAEKLKCKAEADDTAKTISLANSLVRGLASEKVRWVEALSDYKLQADTMCGDLLLATAFLSYTGYFTTDYRQLLLEEQWRPYIEQLQVPIQVTPNLDPVSLLTEDVTVALWQNQGLPADCMSTENATILTFCQRWPLLVDPQMQGIKWIKTKFGEALHVLHINQKG